MLLHPLNSSNFDWIILSDLPYFLAYTPLQEFQNLCETFYHCVRKYQFPSSRVQTLLRTLRSLWKGLEAWSAWRTWTNLTGLVSFRLSEKAQEEFTRCQEVEARQCCRIWCTRFLHPCGPAFSLRQCQVGLQEHLHRKNDKTNHENEEISCKFLYNFYFFKLGAFLDRLANGTPFQRWPLSIGQRLLWRRFGRGFQVRVRSFQKLPNDHRQWEALHLWSTWAGETL